MFTKRVPIALIILDRGFEPHPPHQGDLCRSQATCVCEVKRYDGRVGALSPHMVRTSLRRGPRRVAPRPRRGRRGAPRLRGEHRLLRILAGHALSEGVDERARDRDRPVLVRHERLIHRGTSCSGPRQASGCDLRIAASRSIASIFGSDPSSQTSWSQRHAVAHLAAHLCASSREGTSITVSPPTSPVGRR